MSIYSFVDTVDSGSNAIALPSEALKLNGVYIEHEIPGYKTLSVSGREVLAPETRTVDNLRRDGVIYQGKHYPAREITVEYQLLAENNADFRLKFNVLNRLLSVEEAELIFADEPDKFFTGTLSSSEEVEKGTNNVKASFTFLCSDPFKYSVEEKTVLPNENGMFDIDYEGTVPAYPTLYVDFYKNDENQNQDGDCGFVEFKNKNAVLTFGDPKQTDEGVQNENQVLYSHKFTKMPAESNVTTVKGRFIVVGNTLSNGDSTPSQNYTPAIMKIDLGKQVKNFKIEGVWRYYHHLTDYAFQKILGFYGMSGDSALDYISFKLNQYPKTTIYWGTPTEEYSSKHDIAATALLPFEIIKINNELTLRSAGLVRKFTVDTNHTINNVRIKIDANWHSYCGVRSIKITELNIPVTYNPANTFTTNDTLVVDCKDASIVKNGIPSPAYGSLTNDWEEFTLNYGDNHIYTDYSDWVTDEHKPTFKLKYREVYK